MPRVSRTDKSLNCSQCGHRSFRVLETRPVKIGGVRRRRECLVCNHRSTTYEITAEYLEGLEAENAALQQRLEAITNAFTTLDSFREVVLNEQVS